jgi:hypothetical protein
MMGFDEFARSHGLIVRSLIPHRWIATPTEDHTSQKKWPLQIPWRHWMGSKLGDHANPRYVDFQFKGGLPANVA